MKVTTHIVAVATSRLYTPLLILLALIVLVQATAGTGAGFSAGLLIGLAVALHALVFGAAVSVRAAPPALVRTILSLGLIACVVAAGLPGFAYAGKVLEVGLFALTSASATLVLQVVFGRAPTLRAE